MADIWRQIISFLFPDYCIGCGKEGTVLCALCERTITSHPTALAKQTAALFEYRHPLVRKAIWALKYEHRRALGEYFGIALYREFFKRLAHDKKGRTAQIVLIPIPSTDSALRTRGYNHAELIANGIVRAGKKDGFTLIVDTTILGKTKDAKKQVSTKSRNERLENVRGVFTAAHGETLEGKTVVLIDDVITTGATLREARAVLRPWKPKSIIAIAVAH